MKAYKILLFIRKQGIIFYNVMRSTFFEISFFKLQKYDQEYKFN